jgi:hypothetical protein
MAGREKVKIIPLYGDGLGTMKWFGRDCRAMESFCNPEILIESPNGQQSLTNSKSRTPHCISVPFKAQEALNFKASNPNFFPSIVRQR